jgi:uncharacterized protein YecE (DUF72 family)
VKQGTLRIGTSGIVVPGSKETFPLEYQSKSRLNYYSSLFNTLEVNSTFQKIPRPATLEKWSADVSENFQFTIKLWREITHVKKLKFDLANLDNFFGAIQGIDNKRGCLLIQFPGSITFDYYNEVEEILQRIHQLDENRQWRKAVELRSTTWYVGETYELLRENEASLVLHDMPKSKSLDIDIKEDFKYVRFHGPKGDYRGSYSDEFLEEQAEKIRRWLNEAKDVYVYFNNTMGNAYENAMRIRAMIEA